MKYVLGLIAAVVALGSISARSDEIEPAVSLAWLNSPVTAASIRDDRADGEHRALIKEDESASPEMIAVIENNREDRERTVVIDR